MVGDVQMMLGTYTCMAVGVYCCRCMTRSVDVRDGIIVPVPVFSMMHRSISHVCSWTHGRMVYDGKGGREVSRCGWGSHMSSTCICHVMM